MRADYIVNLSTNRDHDPTPAKVLPTLPIYDQLLLMSQQHGALKKAGRLDEAKAVKEQAHELLDGWLDNYEAEQERIALARAHISEMRARWEHEALMTDIPF